MDEHNINSLYISKLTTRQYSTSFSMGVKLLGKELPLANLRHLWFCRMADEIVDTFHNHNKAELLQIPERTLLMPFRSDQYQSHPAKFSMGCQYLRN